MIQLNGTIGGVDVELVDWRAEPGATVVLTADGDEAGAPHPRVAVVPGDLTELELYAGGAGPLELNPPHATSAVDPPPAVVGVGHPPANAAGLDGLEEDGG